MAADIKGWGAGYGAGLVVVGAGVYAMDHGLNHTGEGEAVDNA